MVGGKRKSRKKKKSSAAAILLTAFLLALAAGGAAAWLVLTPFGPSTETFVELAPGSSTTRIGRQLEAAFVVDPRLGNRVRRLHWNQTFDTVSCHLLCHFKPLLTTSVH